MSEKVYFISGGNRGIGLALVKEISSRPDTKVLTTARVPEKAIELQQLIKERGNIQVFQYEAILKSNAVELAKQIGEVVDGIDVLIPNAAIGDGLYTVLTAPEEVWRDHYNVNVLGTIFLVQELYPLLIKRNARQILFISSLAGSLNNFVPMSLSAYGQSKAALNYSIKELSFELDSLDFTIVAIHPGGVDTDMAKNALSKFGDLHPELVEKFKKSNISPAESASKIISILENLTRKDNGTFINYTGERLEW